MEQKYYMQEIERLLQTQLYDYCLDKEIIPINSDGSTDLGSSRKLDTIRHTLFVNFRRDSLDCMSRRLIVAQLIKMQTIFILYITYITPKLIF